MYHVGISIGKRKGERESDLGIIRGRRMFAEFPFSFPKRNISSDRTINLGHPIDIYNRLLSIRMCQFFV